MLNLRIRTVADNGTVGATSRILTEATNITYTSSLNASATLEFSVSRDSFVPALMPFVVQVEYATDGGAFAPLPENNLFVIETDSDDAKDPSKIVTYSGTEYASWLLAGAYVGTGPGEKDGERTIRSNANGINAGRLMTYFIDESKGRGWLTHLQYDFNGATDSNGAAWLSPGDMFDLPWRLETFYNDVLDQLAESSWCDWSASGRTLHVYRPGTKGADKSHLLLGASWDIERIPVQTDMTGWYTHVLGVYDGGRAQANNASLETRFGRRSMVLSQSGVKTLAAAQKEINKALPEGAKTKREEAYEWTPRTGSVYPFKDIVIGDLVGAKSRGGVEQKRIIGLIASQGEEGYASVQIRVGDKITTLAARDHNRLGSISVGGTLGGNGSAYPTSPGQSPAAPQAPQNVRVAANEGSWGPGNTPYASVEISWDEVVAAVDEAEIDIKAYEVWSRTPSGTPTLDTVVDGVHLSAVIDSWEPGRLRLVSVRAISARNVVSEFSLEVDVTPEAPDELTPLAPQNLREVSNVGEFTNAGPVAQVEVKWDSVTDATDGSPIEVAGYEVFMGGAIVGRTSETSFTLSVASELTREVRVRAVTAIGAFGDVSDVLEITGAKPGVGTFKPSDPTTRSANAILVVVWDGTWNDGQAHAGTVWVEAQFDGVWLPQGAALNRAGSQIVSGGEVGDSVPVRLVAYDPLGRETGASGVVYGMIEGIDGDNIIANSINGNKVVAGTILVDRLAPNIGEQLDISANGAVQIIVGRQNDQDAAIGNAQETADSALSDAEQAVLDAATAAAQAAAADGKALVAQTQAQAAQAALTAHQAVFRVTAEGAEVASVDGSNVLALTPDGVAIIQGGTAASTWDAGRLIVNEAVVNRAQIGAHSFEKYSESRTTVRPLTN